MVSTFHVLRVPKSIVGAPNFVGREMSETIFAFLVNISKLNVSPLLVVELETLRSAIWKIKLVFDVRFSEGVSNYG